MISINFKARDKYNTLFDVCRHYDFDMKFENKYCDSNDLDTIPFDTGDWISDLSKFIHCIGIVNSVIRQSDWFHMANLLRRLAFFKTSWKFVVFIKELLLKIFLS